MSRKWYFMRKFSGLRVATSQWLCSWGLILGYLVVVFKDLELIHRPLKMKAVRSFDRSGTDYLVMQLHIPEEWSAYLLTCSLFMLRIIGTTQILRQNANYFNANVCCVVATVFRMMTTDPSCLASRIWTPLHPTSVIVQCVITYLRLRNVCC